MSTPSKETPEKVLLTITDNSSTFSVSTIINNYNATSMIKALQDRWFRIYGYPDTISFKQGKVQVSKLEKKSTNKSQRKNLPTPSISSTKLGNRSWKGNGTASTRGTPRAMRRTRRLMKAQKMRTRRKTTSRTSTVSTVASQPTSLGGKV